MKENNLPFKRKYLVEQSPPEVRDRFQVELTRTEREMLPREVFARGQLLILEYQDAAAIKFWARYGIEAFSNQARANLLFREVLFLNARRKIRTGANPELELKDKFHQLKLDFGGNLHPPSVLKQNKTLGWWQDDEL